MVIPITASFRPCPVVTHRESLLTNDKAKKNLKEAIEVWIEARAALGWPIPLEEGLESIEVVELVKLSLPQRITYA